MTLIRKITHFVESFQQYFFSYKDGFFIIPIFHNSPQLIIDIFKKTPGVIFNEAEQNIFAKNKILTTSSAFREFDANFWLFYSFGDYHFNTMYKFIYYKDIPVEHHLLAFYYYSQNTVKSPLLTNNYTCTRYGWVLQKPKNVQTSSHFKNTSAKYINVYIPDVWLKEMLKKTDSIFTEDCMVRAFLVDETKKNVILDLSNEEKAIDIVNETEHLINKVISPIVMGEFKAHAFRLINDFITLYNTNYNRQINDVNISDEVRRKMLKAEQFILNHLFLKFPNIEEIAKEINYSVTPLKTNFKLTYGQTIFQYYRNKQLEYSKKVFLETDKSVGDVATILGYENVSKFTLAFKEKYNILPSEVKKKN